MIIPGKFSVRFGKLAQSIAFGHKNENRFARRTRLKRWSILWRDVITPNWRRFGMWPRWGS
jgi:hypothetical protein